MLISDGFRKSKTCGGLDAQMWIMKELSTEAQQGEGWVNNFLRVSFKGPNDRSGAKG